MTPRGRRVAGVIALVAGGLLIAGWLSAATEGFLEVVTRPYATGGARIGTLIAFAVSLLLAPGALFVLALSAFLVVMGVRFLRDEPEAFDSRAEAAEAPTDRTGAPSPTAPVTPVPIPPEEAEMKEGSVAACLRCGSTTMRTLTFSDGVGLGGGETQSWVCDRCHWRGMPLHFDSVTPYRAFVKGLHEDKEMESGPGAVP